MWLGERHRTEPKKTLAEQVRDHYGRPGKVRGHQRKQIIRQVE